MGIEYLGRGGEKHRAPSEGAYAFQPRFVPGNKIEDHDPGRPTEPTERFLMQLGPEAGAGAELQPTCGYSPGST
jgi:hypothetical protein